MFAMIRLFSRVSEHVGSETTSSIARVLALRTGKGFHSSVYQNVSFHIGISIRGIAALVASVVFMRMYEKEDC